MSDRRNRARMLAAIMLVALVAAVRVLWPLKAAAPSREALRIVAAAQEEHATRRATSSCADQPMRRVVLSATSAEPAQAEDRERAVLDVCRHIGSPDLEWFLVRPAFELTRNDVGSARWIARWRHWMRDGTMWRPFDANRLERFACELCAAYGLDMKSRYLLRAGGIETVLDGYDEQRRIGFKLRGEKPWNPGRDQAVEPPSTDLTRADLDRLAVQGIRVHVADNASHESYEEHMPLLAYFASIVEFLNDVTSGPDIDLCAVLGTGLQRLPITGIEGATGWRPDKVFDRRIAIEIPAEGEHEVYFDVQRCTRLERAENYAADVWQPGIPAATRGTPTRLEIHVDFRRAPVLRVTQQQSDGHVLDCSAKGACVLLPSCFDVTRPFTVSLHLSAGEYTFDPYVVIGYHEP